MTQEFIQHLHQLQLFFPLACAIVLLERQGASPVGILGASVMFLVAVGDWQFASLVRDTFRDTASFYTFLQALHLLLWLLLVPVLLLLPRRPALPEDDLNTFADFGAGNEYR